MKCVDLVVIFGAAGVSSVASGQVSFSGTYQKTIDVVFNIDTLDPTLDPPAAIFGQDTVEATLFAETEVTLAESPEPGDVAVDVLEARLTRLVILINDDPLVNVPEPPIGDPVFIVGGEGLTIEFVDDRGPDIELVSNALGAGTALFRYEAMKSRALGTLTLDSPLFDAFSFDLDLFNPFEAQFPEVSYDIVEEDGEVVQQIGLPLGLAFFGAGAADAEFGIIVFPNGLDDFTLTSVLEPTSVGCDPVAHPVGTFGGDGQFLFFNDRTRNVLVTDVNVDGFPDIVTSGLFDFNGLPLLTLLNRGDGTFEDFLVPDGAIVDGDPDALSAGDFNADGVPDVAVAGGLADGLEILLGNGDGTFTLNQSLVDTSDSVDDVTAVDLTGDGFADLVELSSGFPESSINIYLNDGTGLIANTQAIVTSGGVEETGPADFDGDGDIDLAIIERRSNRLDIYDNDGTGTFSLVATAAVPTDPNAIAIGDMNGDGLPDCVVASFNADTVAVVLNNGDGTFGPAVSLVVGDGVNDVEVGDIDNDGDLDAVAVANNTNGTDAVIILTNDGTGTLANPVLSPRTLDPSNVELADIDLDGDLDIMVESFSFSEASGINVFRNGCPDTGPMPCNVADLAPPFGLTDLADVDAFIPLFLAGDPSVDFVDPVGIIDLGDIDAFIDAFLAGCS
ncbi:MAG: VCBS repeat-containing protein [Planctomycetota bacterium]